LDILITVNHFDTKVLIKGSLIECKRGQSVRSLESWAREWNVTKKTVKDFFELLQKDSMLVYESIKISTRITVCNYEDYQGGVNTKETDSKRKVNAEETDSTHKQECKEEIKNDKNLLEEAQFVSILPFEDFWNLYDKKVGEKTKISKKYKEISEADRQRIKAHVPLYKEAQPDKRYRKDPQTYINNKSWNDEIISQNGYKAQSVVPDKVIKPIFANDESFFCGLQT
jgi:hypothetical protein